MLLAPVDHGLNRGECFLVCGNHVSSDASNSKEEATWSDGGTVDDAVLVSRVQAGDRQAFGALVVRYQDRVFNLVLRMCSSRPDAEELAQEAFLKALERIDQFRGDCKFYTWLFRIATNLVISHRRRGGIVKFHSLTRQTEDDDMRLDDAVTADLAASRESGPSDRAISAEVRKVVAAALDSLAEPFRLVLVLRDMQDMDYAEIADVLEVPVGTVKSRLYRARGMLRQSLAGRGV